MLLNLSSSDFQHASVEEMLLFMFFDVCFLLTIVHYLGEILLQKQFPGANFICTDVACKYWPWLAKQDSTLSCRQKPLLSVMHAKAHEFKCQV